MWPGVRSVSILSGILIHPAIWPQQTWAKNWGAVPLLGGELGPHLTQCCLGQAKRLAGKTWPIWCWLGHKTLTQSIACCMFSTRHFKQLVSAVSASQEGAVLVSMLGMRIPRLAATCQRRRCCWMRMMICGLTCVTSTLPSSLSQSYAHLSQIFPDKGP